MVNILIGLRIDPLIAGGCDYVYEPVEEPQARATLAFNGFEEDRDTRCWVKVTNGKTTHRARIRQAQVFRDLLKFPN